ncbi:unannotated protein [freshwater metagenome]|uniref:Unannotated protein n=1 Tax=freshwater metagenome TaxID=449393 RepID=A0A6J7T7Y9_9ZZZZ
MPIVDGVVVLNAGICATPRGDRDFTEELTGIDSFDHFSGGASAETKCFALFNCAHKFITHANRVISILILHRDDVFATEVHIEASVTESANLILFICLCFDKFFDIWMIDVEHNHFRCATRSSTRFDGSSRGISSTHERDRARCSATRLEKFFARTDAGEIKTGS